MLLQYKTTANMSSLYREPREKHVRAHCTIWCDGYCKADDTTVSPKIIEKIFCNVCRWSVQKLDLVVVTSRIKNWQQLEETALQMSEQTKNQTPGISSTSLFAMDFKT